MKKYRRYFLSRFLNCLKHKKIVKSVRGPKGGYILAKDPSQINVYDVVTSLEENILPGRCISRENSKNLCKNAGGCASKEVWDEVAEQIKKTLEKFSLKDLAKRTQEINPAKGRGTNHG